MIDKTFDWARKNGRLRENAVHGDEEVRIVLNETFELEDIKKEEWEQTGTLEVEERYHIRYYICRL